MLVAEPSILELIAFHVRHAGHLPIVATSLREARRLSAEVQPDLVVVDADAAADTVAEAGWADLPAVLLTAAPEAWTGAPARARREVLRKPYAPRDVVQAAMRLLARLDAGPPRAPAAPADEQVHGRSISRAGPIVIDLARQLASVKRAGVLRPLDLAPVELKLLQCLVEEHNRVLSREQILHRVWGRDASVDVRTVDQNIKRLRRGLQPEGVDGCIKTVRGLGYRLCAEVRAGRG